MSNPWLKKNPYLSLWLSGTNRATSIARGQMAAEMSKQGATMTRDAIKFWSAVWFPAAAPKSKRKR